MDIVQLLEDDFFNLPLQQKKSGNFKQFITKYLNDYLNLVNKLEDGNLKINDIYVSSQFIKNTQKETVSNLKKCINAYYNGKPTEAYNYLNKALRGSSKDLSGIFKVHMYKENEDFYRIRLNESNYPFDKKEIFHIPFELRNKIKTQRFSIPGFPSLYLGRTFYICWEELGRPNIDKVQAVRLHNVKTIKCLDLTPPQKDCNDLYEKYKFLMTFPLIACCSVKVYNSSDIFKPEYIVPQLLLQWVRNNTQIDGIKYKSTHISSSSFKENSELINIVLPVKTNRNKGLCKKLKSRFLSTDVLSWNLYQIALGGQTFLSSSNEVQKINNKIPNLEIIKNKKHPYSYSPLGRLEKYLDYMELSEIEN